MKNPYVDTKIFYLTLRNDQIYVHQIYKIIHRTYEKIISILFKYGGYSRVPIPLDGG